MCRALLLTAIVTAFLLACRKGTPEPSATPPIPVDTVVSPPVDPVISPSVYIAGDSFDLSTNFFPYPIYWKNGRQVHLPLPVPSSATGIAVTDSAVYVSNSGIYQGSNITYWRNGVGINLEDTTIIYPTATGITVSGNNVYTAGGAYINGFEKFVPIYWKNQDKAIKISTYDQSRSQSTAIAVSGNDVYLTGHTISMAAGYGRSSACYWKNGTPTFLYSPSTIYVDGIANAIALSDTDVHVVGNISYTNYAPTLIIATYWKNGKPTELTVPFVRSIANAVFVDGDDVYIAGGILGSDGMPRATYWKNGVAAQLDTKYSEARAITVYNNDVYVAGNRGSDTALYWKNSQPVILGRGRANAIVVRK